MCQSLAAETFHDVWNPSAGLWPFTLLDLPRVGRSRAGTTGCCRSTVLVASFTVQTHLTYLPPTLALLAVGLGGLAAGAARAAATACRDRNFIARRPGPDGDTETDVGAGRAGAPGTGRAT